MYFISTQTFRTFPSSFALPAFSPHTFSVFLFPPFLFPSETMNTGSNIINIPALAPIHTPTTDISITSENSKWVTVTSKFLLLTFSNLSSDILNPIIVVDFWGLWEMSKKKKVNTCSNFKPRLILLRWSYAPAYRYGLKFQNLDRMA